MKFYSNEGGVRREYPLREGSLIIGRHPSCHIVTPGRRVSKQHLQCYIENKVVTIRDLGSSNGTTVNGSPVTSCVLNHGDELAVGGYRLVLDLTDEPAAAAAAPPDPYAATAKFDYEPAGTEQPGATAPPTSRPEPEISFDKAPDDDETPADGEFIPQAYAPQSLQPQVVAREGRMYLRDPRTAREVEIVPRGAAAQADLSGYYAGREAADKRKNMYLIAGAIAVGILMIIALAWTSGPGEEAQQVQKKAFPRSGYDRRTEQGIELMEEGNFNAALKKLREADKEYPSYGVAPALIAIAEKWQKSGKSNDEFAWLSVEGALRELRENHWSTTKVRSFAKDRIDLVYDRQHQEAIVARALQLRDAGQPEKALDEFNKLPKDSRVREEHARDIADIIRACFNHHLRLAKEAMQRAQWPAAIQGYQAAERYASALQKPDIARGIRAAAKRINEERILKNVAARLYEVNPASLQAALRLLDDIEDSGPLAARKAQLRQRIQQKLADLALEKKAALAKAAYRDGRGLEAISLITQNKLVDLYPIRTKIENILRVRKEARKALADRDYDLARDKWTAVAGVETSANNAYHRESLTELDGLKRRAKEIAAEYNRRGDLALQADQPQLARSAYLRAMAWDPLATMGKDGLANLRHLAEITYKKARDLEYKGGDDNIKEAIRLYQKVLKYVQEGNTYYKWAKQHLAKLGTEGQPK